MDPKETLQRLIECACTPAKSPEHAHELAEDIEQYAVILATWRRRMGYAPNLEAVLSSVFAEKARQAGF